MTETKRNGTSDASMPIDTLYSMTSAHKLIFKVFSSFIRTFTWTAFFPVAAAEPVPVEPPPDFASLFILFVELSMQLFGSNCCRETIGPYGLRSFLDFDNDRCVLLD